MISGKKVIAITLARGGSKRVPKKNLSLICGKPLLEYTIDEVKKSKLIDNYVISSDDEDILSLALSHNVQIHKRSDINSSDCARSADALIEVLASIDESYDYIIEVMCTNPFKTVQDIDNVITKLDATHADSVVSVCRVWDHHPSRLKFIQNDELVSVFPEVPESRRQDLSPPAYVRNGSIYAMTNHILTTYKRRLGPTTRPYIMPEERSINIDEKIDLLVAQQIMKERQNV